MEVAERIRRAVESTPIYHEGQEMRLTISVGIAEKGPDTTSVADVIASADEAMYRAKSEGRNRVCVLSEGSASAGPHACAASAPAPLNS